MGRTFLPPLKSSEMYSLLQEAARTRKIREDRVTNDTIDSKQKKDTSASLLKKEYPYSITLTKDRVWDELWDLVMEWDIKNDLKNEIKLSSPKKKRRANKIESPTKKVQICTLLDMPRSPIKLKDPKELSKKITPIAFGMDDDSDIIEFELSDSNVIDLTYQDNSLILLDKSSNREEVILSSD